MRCSKGEKILVRAVSLAGPAGPFLVISQLPARPKQRRHFRQGLFPGFSLARLRSSIVGRPSTFFPAPFLCNPGWSFSHVPFQVFRSIFPLIFLITALSNCCFFDAVSQLPRLIDNFMAKVTLVNDKLGYTLIGCQGLIPSGVMLGLVNLFVDNFLEGS